MALALPETHFKLSDSFTSFQIGWFTPRFINPAKWGLLIEMTDKRTWKSKAFLIGISALGSLLVCSALVSTLGLPLLTSAGLLSWLVLVGLTLAASRFTVSITSTVGVSQSRKSVAAGHPAGCPCWSRLHLRTRK